MYLRTVLRSHSSCRAIAETDSPWRCKSKIITSSPNRITAPPSRRSGGIIRVIGDRRAAGPPGARPGRPGDTPGEFSNGASGENHSATDSFGRRQVFRLLKAYRTEGPTGLISKRRGRRGNRRKPEALRRAALAFIRKRYWNFGPTLVAEKLREAHGMTLGRETLRLWDDRSRAVVRSQAAAKARPSAALPT